MTAHPSLRRLSGLAAVLTALVAATSAEAACFSVQSPGGAVTINYSPLTVGDTTKTFQIEVTNINCGTAAVPQIGVSNVDRNFAGAANGSRTVLSYDADVKNGSSGITLSSDTDQLALVTGTAIDNGQTASQTWTLRIPEHSVVPYAQRVFTIYTVGSIGGSYSAATLQVHVNVATVTQLSFAGAGTELTVDFGELSTGETEPNSIAINAQATVPFDITWTSDNNGVLKNLSDESWTIPYTAVLNGTTVSNSTHYTDTTPGGTQGAESSLSLHLTVGDVTGKRAGTYRDIVTIKIQPHA
jgi:hypothetical protein